MPRDLRIRRCRCSPRSSRCWRRSSTRMAIGRRRMRFVQCMCGGPMRNWREIADPQGPRRTTESRIPSPGCMNVVPAFRIDLLEGETDLDGVLDVERESFTSPWTREMYAWELQNRAVCYIYLVRTPECPVAGSCAFW